jgi:glycosyltransferase involved in cell wall biosynthesis
MRDYPRVLIVSKSLINDRESAGASLRNWFKEWPKECLAQLFSGVAFDTGAFCSSNFRLGAQERRFGKLFNRLKGSSLGDAAQPVLQAHKGNVASGRREVWRKAVYNCGSRLIESGLWEFIFPPRLSPRLKDWLRTFGPDVMFIQGADVSFMRLPLMIQDEFRIPICFNILDDWVEHLYEKSPLAPLVQNFVRDTFCRLIGRCTRRFTIGGLMAEEYEKRYGVAFSTLMQCDDLERFSMFANEKKAGPHVVEIVYSGTLALDRWRALVELALAAEALRHEGLAIAITAFAPFVPVEAGDSLNNLPGLTVADALADKDVPRVLSAADILFLPESFDEAIRSYIRLSVSTKAHLYMMSGRPVLVYGPPEIGTVDYARREGWGYVVDREGVEPLTAGLRKVLTERDLRGALVQTGLEVAARNHDGKTVRERLRRDLIECVTGTIEDADGRHGNL